MKEAVSLVPGRNLLLLLLSEVVQLERVSRDGEDREAEQILEWRKRLSMECGVGLVRPERLWDCGKESGQDRRFEMKKVAKDDIHDIILHIEKNY